MKRREQAQNYVFYDCSFASASVIFISKTTENDKNNVLPTLPTVTQVYHNILSTSIVSEMLELHQATVISK